LGQASMTILPRPPGVVDPPGIATKISAAVDREDLQIRVTL